MPTLSFPNTSNQPKLESVRLDESLSDSIDVNDSVYGECYITEPVLVELTESRLVQRLKQVAQHGTPRPYYPERYGGFSRYDHSVGAMILMAKLGGSVESQASALLHDINHTAFSHIGDWVLGDKVLEEAGDVGRVDFLRGSEIELILKNYELDPVRVFSAANYPLLELPSPGLCADRIDYVLREAADWFDPSVVPATLPHIINFQDKLAFNNQSAALTFAGTVLKLQEGHWSNPEINILYELMAGILKRGLDNGLLATDDLYHTDNYLIGRLQELDDPFIAAGLDLLSRPLEYVITTNGADFHLQKKFRYVDPLVVTDNQAHLLTELDADFKAQVQAARAANQRGTKVKLPNVSPKLIEELRLK